MGNTGQSPLGFHLLQPAEMKPSEAHIVFNVAEDRLYLRRTFGAQFLSDLAGQVLTGFLAVFEQAMADADPAIPLGFGTLAPERTIGTIKAFIMMPVREIPIVGGVA